MKKYAESPFSHLSEQKIDDYLSFMGHKFSEENLSEIIKKTTQKQSKRKSFWVPFVQIRTAQLIVLVLVVFILIPSTVFAVSKLWEAYLENDNYASKLIIKKDKSTYETDTSSAHKLSYRLKMSYLPENWGPIPQNEGEVPNKFWNITTHKSEETISTTLIKLTNQNEFETRYTKNSEELELGKHKVWLIHKEGQIANDMDREAYVLFENEGYVLFLMIGKGIEEEQLKKVIAGAQLEESTSANASDYVTDMSLRFNEEPSGYVDAEGKAHWYDGNEKPGDEADFKLQIASDSQSIKQVNERIHFSLPIGGETEDQDAEFAMKVTNVEVYDQLSKGSLWKNGDSQKKELVEELTTEKLMDKEGNFLPFQISTYEKGDGINSVDKLINSESSQLKLVELQVVLENLSDKEVPEVYFQPSLLVLKEQKNCFENKYDDKLNQFSTPTYYGLQNDLSLRYLTPHGEGKGYLNIGRVPQHSAITVTIGCIVPVEDVKDLFLDRISYGYYDLNTSEKIQLFSN